MQWKQHRQIAKSFCDTFPSVRTLMSQLSTTHMATSDGPEGAPSRSQYETAVVGVLLFLNTFLTCSPWRELEEAWECVSTVLYDTEFFSLSVENLAQASPLCVGIHLNVARTLESTLRFLADRVPSYAPPPWLDHMRAIGQHCEVRIATPAPRPGSPTGEHNPRRLLSVCRS